MAESQSTYVMNISDSLNRAVERTRWMLFQPFNLGKWLAFGLIIFLDVIAGSGCSFWYGNPFSQPGESRHVEVITERTGAFVTAHLVLIGVIALAAILIGLVLMVFFTWLTSHGWMMFIRGVARNDADISANWRETRVPARSLFLFRIVFGLCGAAAVIILAAIACFGIFLLAADRGPAPAAVSVLLLASLGLIASGLVLAVIGVLLRSFVAPLMYHFGLPCLAAWRVFLSLAAVNKMPVLLFLLLRLAYAMAFGIVGMMAGCLTCCLGFLPVVYHTIMSPFYVFDRAFPMYMLASIGPEYDMLAGEDGTAPEPVTSIAETPEAGVIEDEPGQPGEEDENDHPF